MKILAIETSSHVCSVALLQDQTINQQCESIPQQHGRFILPFVESLLTHHNLKLSHLDAIAFGCGPGSYTGLRIGISVVQGLAFAGNIPVMPVSSMRTVAQQVWEHYKVKNVLICQDARMQELYFGGYELNTSTMIMDNCISEVLTKPGVIAPPQNKQWVAAGNGWLLYPELQAYLDNNSISYLPHHSHAEAATVAKIAAALFDQESKLSPENALPTYLRQADAWKKINEQS